MSWPCGEEPRRAGPDVEEAQLLTSGLFFVMSPLVGRRRLLPKQPAWEAPRSGAIFFFGAEL